MRWGRGLGLGSLEVFFNLSDSVTVYTAVSILTTGRHLCRAITQMCSGTSLAHPALSCSEVDL